MCASVPQLCEATVAPKDTDGPYAILLGTDHVVCTIANHGYAPRGERLRPKKMRYEVTLVRMLTRQLGTVDSREVLE